MNGPDDNRDFDRVASALRTGDSELPPASVDQAVLKQAADALDNGHAKYRVWHRWLVSGALAATLVLSVSLTVQLLVPQTAIMTTLSERKENPAASDSDMGKVENYERYLIVEEDGLVSGTASGTPPIESDAPSAARLPASEPTRGEVPDPGLAAVNSAIDEQPAKEVTGSRIRRVDVDGPVPPVALGAAMSPNSDDLRLERFSDLSKEDRSELRQLVEAQQEQDRQEFLETYLDSDEYRQAVYGDPDRWLAGIADLIDMGEIVLARNELDEFRVAFPDYELDERFQL